MVATKPIITDTPARFSSGNSEKLVAKTVGIIAPPRNPWSERKTISDSMFQASAQARLMNQTHEGEARRRYDEKPARRQHPRQDARQRDHDDFGDQVRSLDPAYLVCAGRNAGLDFGQTARHDLDVEDRHEHADDHGEEADPVPRD